MTNLEIICGEVSFCLSVKRGTVLSQVLSKIKYAPDMPCGGHRHCGKCRVHILGSLSPVTAEERIALTEADLQAGIRLACCTQIMGNACVVLAPSAIEQICIAGVERDFEKSPMFSVLGAAIDVGTTTLAARLYDENGLIISASDTNPQRRFGADVISRIDRALAGEALHLSRTIREAVQNLLIRMCMEAGKSVQEIDGLVITGNTAMLYLLTETNVAPLATAPFMPEELFGKEFLASDLGLTCALNARVYLPRCISAFVGADITTALLASGICQQKRTALLIDIGTNGEIALWHQGKLFCCSTAAGPAFEGASLSQGMAGGNGAIDHVWIQNEQLKFHTIGEFPAAGICGSGVADLLACLLKIEGMDRSGRLMNEEGVYQLNSTVSLSQVDIRQIQLAKSAIRAGMETLLQHSGLIPSDVGGLSIAGGFGSYLSLESAVSIGLLPPELAVRSSVLGNAALSGASMLLCGQHLRSECDYMAKSETIELAANPIFAEKYIDYMSF